MPHHETSEFRVLATQQCESSVLEYEVMDDSPLDWDSTYEIVLELIERYPDVDVHCLTLDDLNRRICDLPGFAGDPAWVNDKILRDILREWYEEIGA